MLDPYIDATGSYLTRRTLLRQLGLGTIGWLAVRTVGLAAEPVKPDGSLKVHSAEPFNAETRLDRLIGDWITPVEHFYVRSNGTQPAVTAQDFRLSVEGLVNKPLTLSLAQLRETFPASRTVATLVCAGNRRSEHSQVKPVDGVQWGPGAIGNARWSGVRLADLLRAAGVREGARHVWFEGLDQTRHGGKPTPFGASIPLERAMLTGDGADVLLAHDMNQRPLTPEHGFPLRAVVPGYIGSRSVKWLGKIVVADRPSANPYVAHSYKLVVQDREADWSAAPPINEFPINSAICRPAEGAAAGAGKLLVAGYALPPGRAGRTIERVELSTDEGRSWMRAEITTPSRAYCWCLWRAELPIAAATRKLLVRAIDSAGQAQPEKPEWNLKGYLYNGWHRVMLK